MFVIRNEESSKTNKEMVTAVFFDTDKAYSMETYGKMDSLLTQRNRSKLQIVQL